MKTTTPGIDCRRGRRASRMLLAVLLLTMLVGVGCQVPNSPVTGGPCPIITAMVEANPGGPVAGIFADDPSVARKSAGPAKGCPLTGGCIQGLPCGV